MQFLVLLEIGPNAINGVPVIHCLIAEAKAAGAVCAVSWCVKGAGFDV